MIAFDLETAPTRPGCQFPPVSCLAWHDGASSGLVAASDAVSWFEARVDEGHEFTNAFIAFDLGVLACEGYPVRKIFDLYDQGRISDPVVRQNLIDAATLGYVRDVGLVDVAGYYGVEVTKDVTLEYGELRNVPFDQWTPRQLIYPIEDAVAAYRVHERQPEAFLADAKRQAYAAWALALTSARGLVVDPVAVQALKASTVGEMARLRGGLRAAGIVRPDREIKRGPNPRIEPGTRNMKLVRDLVIAAYDGNPPMTDDGEHKPCSGEGCEKCDWSGVRVGQPKTDAITCEDSGDDTLIEYARYSSLGALLETTIPIFEGAMPIHTRFATLKVTGRSGSSKPNIQNFGRKEGIREVFVPRPGYLFLSADFPGLELCAWAEECLRLFGFSDMADAINRGLDPHRILGAAIEGSTYEQCSANARQLGKHSNFGFMGGMGAKRFVALCRKFGVRISVDDAYRLRKVWELTWREASMYLAHVGRVIETDDGYWHGDSDRYRAGLSYSERANTPFQGRGADCAKHALCRILRACYAEVGPLRGSFPVNFPHDEYLLETPIEADHTAAGARLCEIMTEAAAVWMPHVRIKVEPVLSYRWSKKAKTRIEEGRLLPWAA